MKTRPRFFLSLSLLIVLLASCAPAAVTQTPVQPVAPVVVEPSQTPIPNAEEASTPTIDLTVTYTLELLSATPAVTAFPVATSRGPNLEATDPTTVSLASGQIQFIEFFQFWWTTCQRMAPMVHGLEAKYFGRIKFTYLDAGDPQTLDFQHTLGFRSQPEVYLLDGNGNLLKKFFGYTTAEQFESAFAQYVQ